MGVTEAQFQTIASETLRGISTTAQRKPQTFFGELKPQRIYQDQAKDRQRTCKVCGKNHPIWACENFKAMSVPKRWEVAKKDNFCFRCLGQNHVGRACTRARICGLNGCKDTHNRLLHEHRGDRQDQPRDVNRGYITNNTYKSYNDRNSNTQVEIPVGAATEGEQHHSQERSHTTTVHTKESTKREYIALRTVPVVLNNGERKLVVNALLDDASTKSYINSDVAAQLGLHGTSQRVTVNVLNGQVDTFDTMPVEFGIESLDGKTNMKVAAFTADRVTGNMKVIDWNNSANKWDHLRGINFPYIGPRPIVDILIGIDCADLHYSIQDIRGNSGEPVARLTPLGWTCIGHPITKQETTHQTNFIHTYFVRDEDDELNKTLRKFWETEEVPSVAVKHLKTEDQEALKTVETSMKFKDGRYEIGIPWKRDKQLLPDNYYAALKRLENTERRLLKDPEIRKSYSGVIDKYVEKGYIKKIPKTERRSGKAWYLPHFAVVRPDKATTKTRIVFDASAKSEGIALNDVIHQGPKLQRELFDVLLRFRQQPVALACDIAEMYLRIGLTPEDRPYQRFLWRDLDQTQEPDEYEFNRVVFGVNSSPFQAQFVTQAHATQFKEEFPMAAETVLESTYMDDSMDSTPDDQKGIELYRQLSTLWGKAGMHARKWISNSEKVLEEIPVEDRAAEIDLDKGYLPSVKTLGVLWKAKEDVFTYKSHPPESNQLLTKRSFLKKIATLFDPLGFLSPFTICAKVLMQELWTTGLDWDDPLMDDQARKATKWFKELENLPSIKVPRCLQPALGDLVAVSLHTFSDASGDAYGAVVYSRCEYNGGNVSVRIIASKSKVAPLRATSIPRLELMGAVLGLRLSLSILKALKIDAHDITFWSDSMNVLWWIQRPSRTFKPFVANRIGEIHSHTNPLQWRYVPTKENPADCVTRGLTVEELVDKDSWWEGPSFLKMALSQWPKSQVLLNNATDREMKSKVSVNELRVMVTVMENTPWRMEPTRFSSWLRLTRTQAWIYRFLDNCRLPKARRTTSELTPEEIADAEVQLIKAAQRESFKEEYSALSSLKELPRNSKLLALKPTLDEDGLLRSDSRLVNADYLPYDTRFPIILPRKNWITKLIVKAFHEKGNHRLGTNQTLSSLSTRFWIMQAREV